MSSYDKPRVSHTTADETLDPQPPPTTLLPWKATRDLLVFVVSSIGPPPTPTSVPHLYRPSLSLHSLLNSREDVTVPLTYPVPLTRDLTSHPRSLFRTHVSSLVHTYSHLTHVSLRHTHVLLPHTRLPTSYTCVPVPYARTPHTWTPDSYHRSDKEDSSPVVD